MVAAVVMLAMTLSFGGAADVFAGKGGCPNDNASNGASKANDKSAHGAAKQAARGC